MEIVPFIVTYNGIATGPAITRCVEHLMTDAPTFGTAIERIDLYAHCRTREPISAGLESMESRFAAQFVTLPFIRFRRAARLFEVAYASQWVHSDNTFGSATTELPVAEFASLCREFAVAMSLSRRRVKRSDAFDVTGLKAHVQRRLGLLS